MPLALNLTPAMPAEQAIKLLYAQLLISIKANEHGIIASNDSEYLHDFRVAVRKTRSGLSQLKGILPESISNEYRVFFSELGKLTGACRDLDVYLLIFEKEKTYLSPPLQQAIQPLELLLLKKQQQARHDLKLLLNSKQYLQKLNTWHHYLDTLNEKTAPVTIKQLATRRIKKNYRKVLQEGSVITSHSNGDELHELRKSCKKLRYLLEFFQPFYLEKKVKTVLKHLKALQDVLGDIQDSYCQQQYLLQYRKELALQNTMATTLEAIDYLIERVISRRLKTREHFNEKFIAFKTIKGDDYF
ncbi:MAG: CHAD domain-containing protein [Methylococcaceae bacterium]